MGRERVSERVYAREREAERKGGREREREKERRYKKILFSDNVLRSSRRLRFL